MGIGFLKDRHLLSLRTYTPEEIIGLLDLAADFKEQKKNGIHHDIFRGKNIALIFEKTSTRTRCAFEVAAHDLGISTTYLAEGSQIGKKESIADTARVLCRMYDGIEYRGFGQSIVEELAKHSTVPVWNGLTNEFHPTQMLADMLTIREHYKRLKGLRLVYFGDARFNIGNSLCVACSKLGIDLVLCTIKKYFPDRKFLKSCIPWCKESGASITLEENIEKAIKGADIVYTDVWLSMGESDEVWAERIADLKPYQVTKKIMSMAKSKAIFMHDLPSFHDLNTEIGKEISEKFGINEMEVTNEVFESKQSLVFEQAENRMHTIKAVIAATI